MTQRSVVWIMRSVGRSASLSISNRSAMSVSRRDAAVDAQRAARPTNLGDTRPPRITPTWHRAQCDAGTGDHRLQQHVG